MNTWIWVFRWRKSEGKEEEARETTAKVRKHWEEAALDQGLDPAKNVILQEFDHEIRVGISEEMDEDFSLGGGGNI